MRLTSSEFNVRLTPEAVLLVSPPSHSTVIHHKRASRYVVLGEILLSRIAIRFYDTKIVGKKRRNDENRQE